MGWTPQNESDVNFQKKKQEIDDMTYELKRVGDTQNLLNQEDVFTIEEIQSEYLKLFGDEGNFKKVKTDIYEKKPEMMVQIEKDIDSLKQ